MRQTVDSSRKENQSFELLQQNVLKSDSKLLTFDEIPLPPTSSKKIDFKKFDWLVTFFSELSLDELPCSDANITFFVTQPTMLCRAYASPGGLPVREPYRFGRGRCSGSTWANRTGLIWLSILSRKQKLKHANKLTFLIIFKKEFFA